MTRQINIKLNEEKFRPLLNDLRGLGGDVLKTDSQLIGSCLFFVWRYAFEQDSHGLTRSMCCMKRLGILPAQAVLEHLRLYHLFRTKEYSEICKICKKKDRSNE